MDEESEKLIPQSEVKKRTVSFRAFIATVALFSVVLTALCLGFGLTLRHEAAFRRLASASASASSYGLPDSLDTIHIDQLINSDELDLQTNFTISSNTTTREYEFNISLASAAPDGFYKPMILVNGQSPGPLIEANIGDTIRVVVNNHMPNTSTSIHWHGIDQHNTTWMDGVSAVTQCAIPAMKSFTYEFRVDDQRGTFWYHAHTSIQYTDGLFGPIVIHDPNERVPSTDDEKIIFLGDHYHTYGAVLSESYLGAGSQWSPDEAGVEPLPDNFLMNGQHTYDCSVVSSTFSSEIYDNAGTCTGGQLYSTTITPNSSVRLRLINHSSFMSFWFSIDNHTIEIVEIDGIEVEPIPSRGVYVNIGQRYSVIVNANQTNGNYYMRATLPETCFTPFCPYTSTGLVSINYQAKGILSYEGVSISDNPVGIAGNTSNPYGIDTNLARGDVWEGCDDMPFDMPVPVRKEAAVDVTPDNTHSVIFQFRQAGEVNRIFINRTSWSPYHDDAQIWQALDQNFSVGHGGSYNSWDFRLDQQVLLIPDSNQGVQIAINSLDIMEHPFHLHFQVVGWGPGEFAGGNKTTWNLKNPMRRDTITIPAQWHIVIRFVADNPGMWALHCHVAWHMEGGMFVSFIERPDDMKQLVRDMDPKTKALAEGFCAKRQ